MSKQSFVTGQVLTAAQLTNLQQTAMLGGDAVTKTASYVLVAADAGSTVAMTSASATTITVNTGLFAAGDTVFIQNRGSGNLTVTAGSATVATAGSLILPQNDAGILYFTATGASIFYDFIQVGAASPLTTKGDLYTFGTSDTRLAVGATNGMVLTVDSAEATGLKYALPAGGGQSYSLISTTNTNSGSTVTISELSSYKNIIMVFDNVSCNTTNQNHRVLINGSTTALNYKQVSTNISTPSSYGTSVISGSSNWNSGSSAGFFLTNNGNATSTTLAGHFRIENAQNSGSKSCFFTANAGAATDAQAVTGMAIFDGAAVTNFSIEVNSGAFQSGRIRLYGSTT